MGINRNEKNSSYYNGACNDRRHFISFVEKRRISAALGFVAGDFFFDSTGSYEIWLTGRAVAVSYGGAPVWSSPEGVKVQAALSCDIDNDGAEELILLCWRIGRYGSSKPFWVERDERKWSQHIFVYEYVNGEIKPKWMSSDIGQDVAAMAAGGRSVPFYRLFLTGTDGTVSRWRWDDWGFSKEETEVSFAVFGDNLLHEPIYRYALNHGGDFGFLYENIKDIIAGSDVAVINQETPLVDNPAQYGGYPRFGTPAQAGQALTDAGFDVVTCATNHMLDRGAEGAYFTREFLPRGASSVRGYGQKRRRKAVPMR